MRDIKARLCAAATVLGMYPLGATPQTTPFHKPADAPSSNALKNASAHAAQGPALDNILKGVIKEALDAGGWISVNEYLSHQEEFLVFRNGLLSASDGGGADTLKQAEQLGSRERWEQIRRGIDRAGAFRSAHTTDVIARGEITQRKAESLVYKIAKEQPELTRSAQFKELGKLMDNGPNNPLSTSERVVAGSKLLREIAEKDRAKERASYEGQTVQCNKTWPGDQKGPVSSYEYQREFKIMKGRLISNDKQLPRLKVHFRPVEFTADSDLLLSHSTTAELIISYDHDYAPHSMSVFDGEYTFKKPVEGVIAALADGSNALIGGEWVTEEITTSIDGRSLLVRSDFPSDKAWISVRDAKQPIYFWLATRPRTTISAMAFKTDVPNLNGRLQAYSVQGTRLFEGRPFDPLLPNGGQKDMACMLPSTDGSCFLTTAAVDTVGLRDDCWELRQLRAMRDRMIAKGGEMTVLVCDYYQRAPSIVCGVNARRDARRIWLRTWLGGIVPAALCARLGWDGPALALYRQMTKKLQTLAEDA